MLYRFLLTVVLVVSLAMPAAAGTITGITGLINIPNADSLHQGQMEAGFRTFDSQSVLYLSFGVIPQLEVGVNTSSRDSLSVTLKGVLTPETRDYPGIAVGLEKDAAYIVLSRNFNSNGLRGHIGVGSSERFNGPFAGLSMVLNPVSVARKGAINPVTMLMLEHDGHRLNAGARIAFTPQLKADLAVLNMDELMVGLSFSTSL